MNREVAVLSDKLIRAINHQTNLDDSLASTRDELDRTLNRLQKSEDENRRHQMAVNDGSLIKKESSEERVTVMAAQLAEEKSRRSFAEREKKRLEQEVENLTTALFEEANQMVASARHDAERVDKKNEQLKGQLEDMEMLLTSHQAQLAQLKQVIEQMSEEHEAEMAHATAPKTSQLVGKETKRDSRHSAEAAITSPRGTSNLEVHRRQHSGDARLMFRSSFRTNISAYHEFINLLISSNPSQPGTRPPSATFGGLNVSGIHGSGLPVSSSPHPAPQLHSNHSNSSINSDAPSPSNVSTAPTTPQSASGQFSPKPTYGITPLKEHPFYKRAMIEDVEPTLRLDTSPILSWLNRRTLMNAVADGNLVVEPVTSGYRHQLGPCAMCGDDTRNLDTSKRFQFRTALTSGSKKRYPACDFCITRLRTTCDFLGFLRIIKDGHWKGESTTAERAAWEECIRLREQMFWSRIGRTDLIGVAGIAEEQEIETTEFRSSGSSTESLVRPKLSSDSTEDRPEPISKEAESDTSLEEAPTEPKHYQVMAPTSELAVENGTGIPDPSSTMESQEALSTRTPISDLESPRVSDELSNKTDERTRSHSLQKLELLPKIETTSARKLKVDEATDCVEESMPGTPQHEIPGAFM